MKILVLDNYDSFVYNIVYLLKRQPEVEVSVMKNDQITLDQVNEYDKIVLSPGPGLPINAGIMPGLIAKYYMEKPILGICLGHQALAEFFGGKLCNLVNPLHGVSTNTTVHQNHYVFERIPQQFNVGHYHSWVVQNKSISDNCIVLATDEQQNCMAITHKKYDCLGLQFHPESLLTEYGTQMLENWVSYPTKTPSSINF